MDTPNTRPLSAPSALHIFLSTQYHKLRSLQHRLQFVRRKNERLRRENIAVSQVHSLLNSGPYLPFNTGTIDSISMAAIFNDITLNNRKRIVELGSGVSTIMLARLIKKNGLSDTKLMSVDHKPEWTRLIRNMLEAEGLDDLVTFVAAPLAASTFSVDDNLWYDERILETAFNEFGHDIDCLIVDGPNASSAGNHRARYPALPYMFHRMHEKCVVFLDNADRKGEQEILYLWRSFGIAVDMITPGFAAMYRGEHFYIHRM
ncbi:MAG: hypothetical protein RL151_35 [Bacteroidota bacterium]|jgi:hypothetical protein